ncbi:hypothetical protein [Pontibacter cellulosilyticus]|uniref:Uncharacterized protein n=1 Tax=Pontibacter cellulosilyticus TaxID=1720253 RepID=A0A923N7I2_9BACT|nr:hypothetical protein [Pontibacter cellulosilyticus]MBC5994335.1 hypothetical protein [Pontibacter cellulosilyticus]
MKKYRNKLKSFLEAALLIAFVFSIGTDRFPYVTNAIIILWLGSIFIGVAENILYRAGYKKSEIRYTTLNDDIGKYSQIGIGSFIILLSVGCYTLIPSMGLYPLAGIGIGILLIVMGILELPQGMMKLKANRLFLSGVEERIDKNVLKLVEIENDNITLIDFQDKVLKQDSLNLSSSSANVIEQFLITHLGSNSLVKNKVR